LQAPAQEQILEITPPTGSRFKGYEDYVVQELVLQSRVIRYRRQRWETPAGETIVAPLPAGICGHYGPELRRFVVSQHHEGQVTVRRLAKQLQALGIEISKRQVVRLLNQRHDGFHEEARDVLRAGLTSPWISVDDTGARHKASNGFCTQIGNAHFTWFGTTGSKSRLNFLELLRAGHTDYVINAEALAYMRARNLAAGVIARLEAHPGKQFADVKLWKTHLDDLGIAALEVTPDPVLIATEGALWGSIKAHGLLADTVIISDDAGQFDVGTHALCWVHYLEPVFIWSGAPRRQPWPMTSRRWTLHNSGFRVDICGRDGDCRCRSRCVRRRASRRMSGITSGALPSCCDVRCTRVADAHSPVMAAIRG